MTRLKSEGFGDIVRDVLRQRPLSKFAVDHNYVRSDDRYDAAFCEQAFQLRPDDSGSPWRRLHRCCGRRLLLHRDFPGGPSALPREAPMVNRAGDGRARVSECQAASRPKRLLIFIDERRESGLQILSRFRERSPRRLFRGEHRQYASPSLIRDRFHRACPM
jgi:hypothetical protein